MAFCPGGHCAAGKSVHTHLLAVCVRACDDKLHFLPKVVLSCWRPFDVRLVSPLYAATSASVLNSFHFCQHYDIDSNHFGYNCMFLTAMTCVFELMIALGNELVSCISPSCPRLACFLIVSGKITGDRQHVSCHRNGVLVEILCR